MFFIWPQLLKIWPQLSPGWPKLVSFGERDGDNFFRARANPDLLTSEYMYIPDNGTHQPEIIPILCEKQNVF